MNIHSRGDGGGILRRSFRRLSRHMLAATLPLRRCSVLRWILQDRVEAQDELDFLRTTINFCFVERIVLDVSIFFLYWYVLLSIL